MRKIFVKCTLLLFFLLNNIVNVYAWETNELDDPGDLLMETTSNNTKSEFEYEVNEKQPESVYKAGGTVLPGTEFSMDECKALMNSLAMEKEKIDDLFSKITDNIIEINGKETTVNDILACGIKTGQMKLWMVPYYVREILEFIIGIAGLLAVAGTVFGGYMYLFAGVSEDKERGKKAILYGISGFVLTLIAWGVVNIVISFFT